jgi:hypothetical protein
MTKIKYKLSNNKFIDIPLKENNHVHRIYIINVKVENINMMKKTDEIKEYSVFSMNKMNENYEMFKNKKIINTNGITCIINKRMKRFLDMFYEMNFSD